MLIFQSYKILFCSLVLNPWDKMASVFVAAEIAASREPEKLRDSWSKSEGTSKPGHRLLPLFVSAEEDSWCCCFAS